MNRQELHFCHISDSHLGNRQYGLVDRFDDFAKALMHSVNECIKRKPDFVIYTGDLFEISKPRAPELRQAVRIIKKLQKAEIPLLMSQGNHDVSYSRFRKYGGDILSFLSDLDIGATYIQDELYTIEKETKHPVKILAVNYYGKRTNSILRQLIEKYKEELDAFKEPKILMLHAFVQGMPGTVDVKTETINKGNFDYVGVGHLHERWEDTENRIYCPGSTEHTSVSEWNQAERGFYDVYMKLINGKWRPQVEYITIPVRKKHLVEHAFESISVIDIREEAEIILNKNDIEDAVVMCKFYGGYEGKEHPFINLEKFRLIPKKALHCIIRTQFLEAHKEEERKPILTEREAYEGILKQLFKIPETEVDEYISLIEESLKIVDGDYTISEQEEILQKNFSTFAKRMIKDSSEGVVE